VQEISELQRALVARGYEIGEVDGKFGALSRKALKQAQIRLGLPADSYPTRDLIEKLRLQTTGNR
jgi:peptidoglycan hydrolase-like protein with peptidoglycan-binding domain